MWKTITEEQIKDVKVGDPVQVNGIISTLESHYDDNDQGFDVATPIPVFDYNCPCPDAFFIYTFSDSSWNDANEVRVWVDDPY